MQRERERERKSTDTIIPSDLFQIPEHKFTIGYITNRPVKNTMNNMDKRQKNTIKQTQYIN